MIRKLIRAFQGSPQDEQESFKKPRRSERLSQISPPTNEPEQDHRKTPVSTKQQLPSPVTYGAEDEITDADKASQLLKEATATPPEGRPSQVPHRNPEDNFSQGAFSSPPQDTQVYPSQPIDSNAPLSDEVEDEVKEGVWGYLMPLDTKYRTVVLRKRSTCPLPNTVAEAVSSNGKKGGRRSQRTPVQDAESFDKSRVKGLPSGGYLIGRHIECGRSLQSSSTSSPDTDQLQTFRLMTL